MDRATYNAQVMRLPLHLCNSDADKLRGMQIKAARMVNPPNLTTADREEDKVPVKSLDSGNSPTPPDSVSVEGLAHASSATNLDTNSTPDKATTISQFMEEKSAILSFD